MNIFTNVIVLAVVLLFIYIFASLLIRDAKIKNSKRLSTMMALRCLAPSQM